MRELAMRGGPFTADERAALLDYCETDVEALARLFPKMLPHIDLAPRAASGAAIWRRRRILSETACRSIPRPWRG